MVNKDPPIATRYPKCTPQAQYTSDQPRFTQYLGLVGHNNGLNALSQLNFAPVSAYVYFQLGIVDIAHCIARSCLKCIPQGRYTAYEPRFTQYLGAVRLLTVYMHFHNSILHPFQPMYNFSWEWWKLLIILLEAVSNAFHRVDIQHMNLDSCSTWALFDY